MNEKRKYARMAFSSVHTSVKGQEGLSVPWPRPAYDVQIMKHFEANVSFWTVYKKRKASIWLDN